MVGKDVKLVCPPGAIENPVSVDITLEDPSKYYDLIIQKNLENDVVFAMPIINLQPSGHDFKKPVTLTTRLRTKNFQPENIVILHGTEARDRKITWHDITHRSKINETTAEVVIEMDHFSLVASLVKFALIRTKDIVFRLNLVAFNYTMSALLNKNSMHDELALLFVSQDVYNEEFYREHESSALVRLKAQGFRELHVCPMNGEEDKRIFNSESLQVSVRLGEDYSLADTRQGTTRFTVHSHVWWNEGEVIKLPLDWTEEVRILCGTIIVQGQYGQCSESHLCETGTFDSYNIINIILMPRLTSTKTIIERFFKYLFNGNFCLFWVKLIP